MFIFCGCFYIAGETSGINFATSIMSSAPNLPDWQLIAGSLLGFLGIFLEGLSYFAIYRLMADAAPQYAHIYRSGIFGYIWLAPVGCHMNIGLMNYAYKNLLCFDPAAASRAAQFFIYAFTVPAWVLLCLFWIPMMVVQFKAFAKGMTPFPCKAKWFCIPLGAVPALLIALMIGPGTALGAGIGTMFLSFGNVFTFGGLLATLPDERTFENFRHKRVENNVNE